MTQSVYKTAVLQHLVKKKIDDKKNEEAKWTY